MRKHRTDGRQAPQELLPSYRAVVPSASHTVTQRPIGTEVRLVGLGVSLSIEMSTPPHSYPTSWVVIPGEGDVVNGCIGADSPVGAALIGRRIGDAVTIAAPAGSWTATVTKSSSNLRHSGSLLAPTTTRDRQLAGGAHETMEWAGDVITTPGAPVDVATR